MLCWTRLFIYLISLTLTATRKEVLASPFSIWGNRGSEMLVCPRPHWKYSMKLGYKPRSGCREPASTSSNWIMTLCIAFAKQKLPSAMLALQPEWFFKMQCDSAIPSLLPLLKPIGDFPLLLGGKKTKKAQKLWTSGLPPATHSRSPQPAPAPLCPPIPMHHPKSPSLCCSPTSFQCLYSFLSHLRAFACAIVASKISLPSSLSFLIPQIQLNICFSGPSLSVLTSQARTHNMCL